MLDKNLLIHFLTYDICLLVRCNVRQVSSLKVSECVLALNLVYYTLTRLLRMANSVDPGRTAMENGSVDPDQAAPHK